MYRNTLSDDLLFINYCSISSSRFDGFINAVVNHYSSVHVSGAKTNLIRYWNRSLRYIKV